MHCDGDSNIFMVNVESVLWKDVSLVKICWKPQERIVLIDITIQSFQNENELELSLLKWDLVNEQFIPQADRNGLNRYSIIQFWNKKEPHQ